MVLEAEVRPSLTKGMLNQTRQEDRVPAVLYGRGKDTHPLIVDGRSLRQLLISGGSNVLIDLKVKEKGKKVTQETVMFKEIQRHIIQKDKLMHVDFIRISMTDKIEVNVQLNFIGEPIGVKDEGGVLQILTREVLVKCLPGDIPETIDVDLSVLAVGDSISVNSINFAEGIELITDLEETLAQILAPVAAEEKGEKVEEGAEGEAEEPGAESSESKE